MFTFQYHIFVFSLTRQRISLSSKQILLSVAYSERHSRRAAELRARNCVFLSVSGFNNTATTETLLLPSPALLVVIRYWCVTAVQQASSHRRG